MKLLIPIITLLAYINDQKCITDKLGRSYLQLWFFVKSVLDLRRAENSLAGLYLLLATKMHYVVIAFIIVKIIIFSFLLA